MNNYEQQGLTLTAESLPADFLAKICPSLVSEQDWQENGVDFSGKSAELLTKQERKRLSSKMSPVFFPPITEETWPSSLKRWSNGGIAWHGGCLTLSISESLKDDEESSLSQVLETQGDHLKKYSISEKAAQGILRRANRRGKTLPPRLQKALESLVEKL